MVRIKNIEDLLAEQAVRKAATCYSRGVDRSDLDLFTMMLKYSTEVMMGIMLSFVKLLSMVKLTWIIQLIR